MGQPTNPATKRVFLSSINSLFGLVVIYESERAKRQRESCSRYGKNDMESAPFFDSFDS